MRGAWRSERRLFLAGAPPPHSPPGSLVLRTAADVEGNRFMSYIRRGEGDLAGPGRRNTGENYYVFRGTGISPPAEAQPDEAAIRVPGLALVFLAPFGTIVRLRDGWEEALEEFFRESPPALFRETGTTEWEALEDGRTPQGIQAPRSGITGILCSEETDHWKKGETPDGRMTRRP